MKLPSFKGLSERNQLFAWLGVLVVVLVVAGIFVFDPKLHALVATTPTASTNTSTYSSSEYGFGFNYPNTWTVSKENTPEYNGAQFGVDFDYPGAAQAGSTSYTVGVYSGSQVPIQFADNFFFGINGGPTNVSETTINGLPAVKLSVLGAASSPDAGKAIGVIVFKLGSEAVMFTSPAISGSTPAVAETNALADTNLNLIASTFSFKMPTVSISASPSITSVASAPTTISWTSANADYVTLDSHYINSSNSLGAITPTVISGSRTYYPTSGTIYTAQACSFSGQCSLPQQVEVTVTPGITTFSANPAVVTKLGGTATINWSCDSNCNYVTITGTPQGTTTLHQSSGSFVDTFPSTAFSTTNSTHTYTLTACATTNVTACSAVQTLKVSLNLSLTAYTNTLQGFGLQIPKTWTVKTEANRQSSNSPLLDEITYSSKYVIDIFKDTSTTDTGSATIAAFVKSNYAGNKFGGPYDVTQTTIDGLPAVKFSLLTSGTSYNAIGLIAFKNATKVYVISSPAVKGSSPSVAESNAMADSNLNLIASTFHLL